MSTVPTFGARQTLKGVANLTVAEHTTSGSIDQSAWWAVYTRHQHEKTLAEMLSLKGFEVFLPLYESTRRWKDRKKVIELPLFPCYLFIRGCIDHKLKVLTTPGVHMILHRGQQIAAIPDEEIESIQRAIGTRCLVEPHPFLKCGMRVRVVRGSLEGLQGILVRKKNLFRLVLSVDMLMQSVSVEVETSDVEPCIDETGTAPSLLLGSQERQLSFKPSV
jgi:transcription antitermination factor NusG